MSPFFANLYSPLTFGETLVISGVTTKDAKILKVNLTDRDENIPLTIFVNLRILEIVLNSFINSEWRESLKVDIAPIMSGKPFKICIFVTEDNFHVAMNDQHLYIYKHQAPVELIKSVEITGDIQKITQVDHRRVYPMAWPGVQQDLTYNDFSADVPHEFCPGSVVVLKMILEGSKNGRFQFKFNDLGTERQMFHFNARFDEKALVVNTMNTTTEWSRDEKRFQIQPFSLKNEFTLAVAITSSSFRVAMNGKHLLDYNFKFIRTRPPTGTDYQHPIFEQLTGFKVVGTDGMAARVFSFDHIQTKEDCKFYEVFSNPGFKHEDLK